MNAIMKVFLALLLVEIVFTNVESVQLAKKRAAKNQRKVNRNANVGNPNRVQEPYPYQYYLDPVPQQPIQQQQIPYPQQQLQFPQHQIQFPQQRPVQMPYPQQQVPYPQQQIQVPFPQQQFPIQNQPPYYFG